MIDSTVAKRNLIAIEDYAKANWTPRLGKYDEVSVHFGKNGRCGFLIRPDGLSYWIGALSYGFGPRDGSGYNNIYTYPSSYTEELFVNWKEIKCEMEAKISELERRRDLINNFEV